MNKLIRWLKQILNAQPKNKSVASELRKLAGRPQPCHSRGIIAHTLIGKLPIECKQKLSAFDIKWLKRNGWKLTKMNNGKYKVDWPSIKE